MTNYISLGDFTIGGRVWTRKLSKFKLQMTKWLLAKQMDEEDKEYFRWIPLPSEPINLRKFIFPTNLLDNETCD